VKLHRPLVVANWKMNIPEGGLSDFVASCSSNSESRPGKDIEVWIAPPFPYLSPLRAEISAFGFDAEVGAQNCSDQKTGALTGEVSAEMVSDQGAVFVILGHSERRTLFGETDALIARKITAVGMAQLVPLVCVGEDLESRERGLTAQVVTRQLRECLGPARDRFGSLVIAYEPLWAIGTGRNASAAVVVEVNQVIRKVLRDFGEESSRVLYGGSVTPENAADLARAGGADGFLIGGASLDPSKFMGICAALSPHPASPVEKS